MKIIRQNPYSLDILELSQEEINMEHVDEICQHEIGKNR